MSVRMLGYQMVTGRLYTQTDKQTGKPSRILVTSNKRQTGIQPDKIQAIENKQADRP